MKDKGQLLAAMTLLLLLSGCSAGKDSMTGSKKSEIDGVWEGILANQSGLTASLVIADAAFEYKVGNRQHYKGTMILRTDVSPKQADMIVSEDINARYAGKTTRAIYELRGNGDSLIVAANEPGIDVRPGSFEMTAGSRTAVFVFVRQKAQTGKSGIQGNVGKRPARADILGNRDALINDLNNLAAFAYQYRIRPATMGGGNGAYTGLQMPEKLSRNDNGTYTFAVIGPDEVKIKAVSNQVEGAAIETTLDGNGRLGRWTYFGAFM